MARSSVASSNPSRRIVGRHQVLLGLFGLLLVAGVIALSTLLFGRISGEEFCPETFRRRWFAYFEIPLVHLQVSRISRTYQSGDLEKHLVTQKLITVPRGNDRRWDLVSAHRSAQLIGYGDAAILCSYLDMRDSGNDFLWLKWSKNHPDLAKVLWPAVAEVARQDLYFFVPDLMDAAWRNRSPEQLQKVIARRLSRSYAQVGDSMQQLERHQYAVELYTYSLKHQPSAAVYRARATSREALGESDRAAADRAAADRLESAASSGSLTGSPQLSS